MFSELEGARKRERGREGRKEGRRKEGGKERIEKETKQKNLAPLGSFACICFTYKCHQRVCSLFLSGAFHSTVCETPRPWSICLFYSDSCCHEESIVWISQVCLSIHCDGQMGGFQSEAITDLSDRSFASLVSTCAHCRHVYTQEQVAGSYRGLDSA